MSSGQKHPGLSCPAYPPTYSGLCRCFYTFSQSPSVLFLCSCCSFPHSSSSLTVCALDQTVFSAATTAGCAKTFIRRRVTPPPLYFVSTRQGGLAPVGVDVLCWAFVPALSHECGRRAFSSPLLVGHFCFIVSSFKFVGGKAEAQSTQGGKTYTKIRLSLSHTHTHKHKHKHTSRGKHT